MAQRKKILADHQQVGKKFYPPAARFGWTEIHYVERILPEIAWLGYFTVQLGAQRGIALAEAFVESCFALKSSGATRQFCLLSNFRTLTPEDWDSLRCSLEAKAILSDCSDVLSPFVRCYPQGNALGQICNAVVDRPSASDVSLAQKVVSSLFDRRSKPASIVQGITLWLDLKLGLYHVPADYPFTTLVSIFGDLDSDLPNEAASHSRMHVNSTHSWHSDKIGDSWAKYFWNRGKELIPLATNNSGPEREERDKLHPVVKLAVDYEHYAWSLVDEIWSRLPVDIYESEVFEVLGALLARQCNLAVKLAGNIDLWDYHAGPLFLRPMTDCCITVAWILKDPLDRARKFILYGLGQEKLEIERLRSVLNEQSGEDRKRMEARIAIQEAWLNAQHYSFLQHVDVGSWSGISTRKMAEEADRLSLYDFAYTGWSHAAHGTWNHIGRFDAFPTGEPLHKHIWEPANVDHGNQVDIVIQATKYFDESYSDIVRHFKLEMKLQPPNQWISERIAQFFTEVQGIEGVEVSGG